MLASTLFGSTLRPIVIVIAVLFSLFILNLLRARRIKEFYTLMWLGVALLILVFVSFEGILIFLSSRLGATSPSIAVFFLAILFLLFLNIGFSVKISELEDDRNVLVQKMAILEQELDRNRKASAPPREKT